jgi:hypothetical protein
MDDGGMSIRLDPRRLGALKLLAAEAGIRPGELVTRWVEERVDAARGGAPAPGLPTLGGDAMALLTARVDELARRLDQLAAAPAAAAGPESAMPAAAPAKRGPGRPRKVAVAGSAETAAPTRARRGSSTRKSAARSRVALHDEIAAVITELGPQTAAELASAIAARGRYRAPRSKKPLDAAQVNARVSNPTYRGRFVRREHRIGLAGE